MCRACYASRRGDCSVSDTVFWVVCIVGSIVICVAIFIPAYWAARIEESKQKAWQAFVDAHDCRIVEQEDALTHGVVGPEIGTDGKVSFAFRSITKDARDCWLCNDGRRYWKAAKMAVERIRT